MQHFHVPVMTGHGGPLWGTKRTPQTQVASRISEFTGNVELFHPCRVRACSPGRGSCALTLLLIPSAVNYSLSLSVVLCHRLGWSSLCFPTGCHVCGYLWSSSHFGDASGGDGGSLSQSLNPEPLCCPCRLPGSSTEMPFAPGLKLHCLLLFPAGERVELQGT